MQSSIGISIIIPCFNSKETLDSCLCSLFSQTTDADEVILIDDASSDNLREIIENYPVHYLRNETNLGPGESRNRGTKIATKDFLLFLDDDVVLAPHQLSKMKSFLSKNPSYYLTCLVDDSVKEDFISDYKNLQLHYNFKKAIQLKQSYLYGSLLAIRKEDFLSWPNCRTLEDVMLHSQLMGSGLKSDASELAVKHLKKYNQASLFSYERRMGRYYAVLKLLLRKKKYSTHVHYSQLLKLALFILSFPLLFYSLNLGFIIIGIIALMNTSFLIFCLKKRGSFFLLKALMQIYISYAAYSIGIAEGLLKYKTLKKEFI